MSWQTPGKEPPPDPAAPEPDAETTRVPLQPPPPEPATEPPTETPGTPPDQAPARRADLRGPGRLGRPDAPAASPGDGPAVPWAPPVQTAAVPVTEGLVIAGVFSRVVAYAIDIVFLQLLSLAVLGLVGGSASDADPTVTLAVAGLFVAVDFLYFVGLWTSGWHATLGMRLLRLRVLSAASAGTLSYNDALLALDRPERRGRDPRARAPGRGNTRAGLRGLGPDPAHHDGDQPAPPGSPRPVGAFGRRPAGTRRLGRSRRRPAWSWPCCCSWSLPLGLVALAGPQLQDLLRQIGRVRLTGGR